MRKFLTTFFVAIALIIAITIVFDISEKLDGFLGKLGQKPTLKQIINDYYFNFIPYFVNTFSPLFVFISVIFFTSRMASKLEIVSIFNTGASFWRLLKPFLLSAVIIAAINFMLTNYVIPKANEDRIKFERTYLSKKSNITPNFHRQVKPGEFVYVDHFDHRANYGTRFSYEIIQDDQLKFKLMSQNIRYDSTKNHWIVEDYILRTITGLKETVRTGAVLDTTFDFTPSLFKTDLKLIQTMSNNELDDFIEKERIKGSKYLDYYLIEKYNRTSNPFSTIILTLLAVPISSRKVRGGIGIHLSYGVTLAFTFIFMMRVTTTYAINGSLDPFLAVWLPNFIFAGIGLILTKFAQK